MKQVPNDLPSCSVEILDLFNTIFEQLPVNQSHEFHAQFLEAFPVGADTSLVWPRFAVWLLTDPVYGAMQLASDSRECVSAIRGVANLYERLIVCRREPAKGGDVPSTQEWVEVALAARAATMNARSTGAALAAMAAAATAWPFGGTGRDIGEKWRIMETSAAQATIRVAQATARVAQDAATRKQRDMLLALLRECGEVQS